VPRTHRRLMWQLLHAAIDCGAYHVYHHIVHRRARTAAGIPSPYCHQAQCVAAQPLPPTDTITHRLIDCPIAGAVWSWTAAVWAAATASQGPAPPRNAAVLLAADGAAWSAGDTHARQLWHIMRVSAVYFLWHATSAARRDGRTAQPAAVVARLVAFLRRRMMQDYTRATLPPTAYAAVCGSWLPRRPQPSMTDFRLLWGRGGVLCTVTGAEGLQVKLSAQYPAPPPSPVYFFFFFLLGHESYMCMFRVNDDSLLQHSLDTKTYKAISTRSGCRQQRGGTHRLDHRQHSPGAVRRAGRMGGGRAARPPQLVHGSRPRVGQPRTAAYPPASQRLPQRRIRRTLAAVSAPLTRLQLVTRGTSCSRTCARWCGMQGHVLSLADLNSALH
jgi:hypothetical protein